MAFHGRASVKRTPEFTAARVVNAEALHSIARAAMRRFIVN
jgi:4'-phosphopantetheinyl transferase EntD